MFSFIIFCVVFILPISMIIAIVSGVIGANKKFKDIQIKNNKDIADKLIEDNKYKEELIYRQKVLDNINNKV